MDSIITLIVQTLSQAPIFLGLVSFFGLLLQKKQPHEILEGVIKTVVGMVMLSSGSSMLTNSLTPLISKLNESGGVQGILPQNYAALGEVMSNHSTSVVFTFIGAFFLNLVLVKILPWKNCKNVYLTVHLSLIISAFLVMVVPGVFGTKVDSTATILISATLLGVFSTLSPAIPRIYSREWTGEAFTLGHNQQFGTFFASKLAKLVGDPADDAENIKLPKSLSVFKDNTVSLAILMPTIFIGIGLTVGRSSIEELSGSVFWLVWLFLQGITFTAGFVILLNGVRMFVAQVLPAFKGIADKFAKGSIPALDCPVFYTYSSTGAMLGFLASLIGAILVTVITIVFRLPVVIFPSPNICFFDGCLLGVFGNKHGGWKGAIAAGFILSFITHILVMFIYPLTGELYGSGATFSQTDFSIFWLPFMLVAKAIRGFLGF